MKSIQFSPDLCPLRGLLERRYRQLVALPDYSALPFDRLLDVATQRVVIIG